MLVLTRLLDESVMIGDIVEIRLLSIQGNRVRLGIEAPVEVKVHRKEVWDAIQREKQAKEQQ